MVATALNADGNLMRSTWRMSRDQEGHRDYYVTWYVQSDITDGPTVIETAAGLPMTGSTWTYGGINPYAFCWPIMEVRHHPGYRKGHPARWWEVDQRFSTRPLRRCQDEAIEDPLLEPQNVSGSFVRFTREITKDRNGNLLKTASHQPLKGSDVEFDDGTPSVHIEQNKASLGLTTFAELYNTVNDATLWDLTSRKIKLSNVGWRRLVWGTCDFYYQRIFDFDINFKTFDRQVADYSNHCVRGEWNHAVTPPVWVKDPNADSDDPSHMIRYKDVNDENSRVLLNVDAEPISGVGTGTGTVDDIHYIDIEYYDEGNFLLLGIPTSF